MDPERWRVACRGEGLERCGGGRGLARMVSVCRCEECGGARLCERVRVVTGEGCAVARLCEDCEPWLKVPRDLEIYPYSNII